MTRVTYTPEEHGKEVEAPWGYYQPMEVDMLEQADRTVLYTLGSACVEASCCGVGSWSYARVEGFVVGDIPPEGIGESTPIDVETVEGPEARVEITRAIQEKHPGVRVEFR